MQTLRAALLVALLVGAAASEDEAFPLLRRKQDSSKANGGSKEGSNGDQESDAPVDTLSDDLAPTPAPLKIKTVRLPPVSSVMSSASKTLDTISTEVSQLESRVHTIQTADQDKLAKKKAGFEQRLEAQEQRSESVNATNQMIAKEISTLQLQNAAARQHAASLEKANKLMRQELGDIQTKLYAAKEFITGTLGNTDDRHSKELAVLQISSTKFKPGSSTPKLSSNLRAIFAKKDDGDDNDDDQDDDDSDKDDKDDKDDDGDDKPDSFLGVSSFVERMAPKPHVATDGESEGILSVLNRGLVDLAKQEKAGSEQLDHVFHAEFQAGRQKRAKLLAHQRQLNSTRDSLTVTSQKLDKANQHLEKTKSRLQKRLRAVGLYLQRMAHLVLAPPEEAQALIASMPKAVPP